MEKKQLKNIVRSLKLEPNNLVLENLEDDFLEIDKKLKHMTSINVDGITPMVRIDDRPTIWFREDDFLEMENKLNILDNAPNSDKDYIIINKVIK